jgi:hypothetical protein
MLLGLVTPASGTAAIGGRPYRELACPLRLAPSALTPKTLAPRQPHNACITQR